MIGEYDLVASKEVKKKNFINLFLDNLKDMVVGRIEF